MNGHCYCFNGAKCAYLGWCWREDNADCMPSGRTIIPKFRLFISSKRTVEYQNSHNLTRDSIHLASILAVPRIIGFLRGHLLPFPLRPYACWCLVTFLIFRRLCSRGNYHVDRETLKSIWIRNGQWSGVVAARGILWISQPRKAIGIKIRAHQKKHTLFSLIPTYL